MTADTSDMPLAPAPVQTPRLNKALSLLQGELPRIAKSKQGVVEGVNKQGNRFSYTYAYADLADVVAEVGPLLAKYGLAFTSEPTIDPAHPGRMVLPWSLLHESGESRSGVWPLGPVDQKPQSLGSALTYGRRYTFSAALNIVADEDDDGQRAQQQQDGGRAAGDAWPTAAPARTRSQAAPDDTPEDREAAARAWVDDALAKAPALPSDRACRKLWHDAGVKANAGEITSEDAGRIQELCTARAEELRVKAYEAAMSLLSEDEPWREAIEGIGDTEEARGKLAELERLTAAGTVDKRRAGRISRAIVAKFPKATQAGEAP